QRELLAFYEAFASGRLPATLDLGFQFPQHAAAQRELVHSTSGQEQAVHWQRALASLPDQIELPFANPAGSVLSLTGGTVELSLSSRAWAELRRLAEEEASGLDAVVLTGLAVYLHRCGRV